MTLVHIVLQCVTIDTTVEAKGLSTRVIIVYARVDQHGTVVPLGQQSHVGQVEQVVVETGVTRYNEIQFLLPSILSILSIVTLLLLVRVHIIIILVVVVVVLVDLIVIIVIVVMLAMDILGSFNSVLLRWKRSRVIRYGMIIWVLLMINLLSLLVVVG